MGERGGGGGRMEVGRDGVGMCVHNNVLARQGEEEGEGGR